MQDFEKLALNMEAVGSSETLISTYKPIRCYNPEAHQRYFLYVTKALPGAVDWDIPGEA
jgi:hypothetical protein